MEGLLFPAFLAGVLTILAPCTLPLIPAYLGFISGSSLNDVQKEGSKVLRAKFFFNGLLFVLGFTLIFVSFGVLVGFFGAALVPFRNALAVIGGILVIFFGLFMLGVFKLPFLAKVQTVQPRFLKRGQPFSSFVLGSSFAVGWTPCVGPILGSILVLASTTQTALQGGFLLLIFSLGLAVPFLLIALSFGSVNQRLKAFSRHIEVIGGVFLLALGVLLLTGKMALLISWGYRLFRFINYDRLLNYL